MTTPADRNHQSPLEAALLDVHATLRELIVAADEQYAAVVERDRERLESVTRRQERLAARLARAERARVTALDGRSFQAALVGLPADESLRLTVMQRAIGK